MKNKHEYFCLFANCIPVKGIKRSIICDLQNGTYIFIENELIDLLLDSPKTIEDLNQMINSRLFDKLMLCFESLVEFNYGHYCENPYLFPKMSTEFNSPYEVIDCILELSEVNYRNINYILKSLTNLGCQVLELRSYETFDLDKIEKISNLLVDTKVRSLEVSVAYSLYYDDVYYEKLIDRNQIIGSLIVHSASKDFSKKIGLTNLIFTTQKLDSAACCGNISRNHLQINLQFYLHGLKHNTCLYKKVSVLADGTITNCPSLTKNYGTILDKNFEAVVRSDSFKELWDISKDQINICKSCEFRYICSDCRAFVDDNYQKPLKCNYDPFSASIYV